MIREIKNKKNKNKKVGVRQEFCLVNSKIQTIWKDRTKIVSAFEKNR